LSLTLNYRPPFAWDDLLRFLADRATPGVEKVEGDVYSRTLAVDDCLGWLRVEHDQPKSRLVARLSPSLAPVLCHVLNGLRRLFDLDARPDLIDRHLAADPLLAPSVHSRPGLRAPGAMCGFELLVRAILGQQVSVRGATTLAGRLAERFGDPAPTPDPALNRLAPTASKLASLHETQLVDLGVTRQRARAVIAAARATVGGEWTLGPTVDPESALHRLTAIEGIGEWTARYVAMRALRWPDAFPSGDLVVRRMLGVRSPSQAERRAERWRPWRSYAVMHLWYSASSQSIQEK
jgi:AraC family transcriptional regulator of adaptative response / DNA-3-methyladenine glycosylase II